MSSVHEVQGTAHVYGPVAPLVLYLIILTTVHVARAVTVSPAAARRWAESRALELDVRSLGIIEQHLRRTHAARAVTTALVGSVSVGLALLSRPTISFFSVPLVLGVLIAQSLLPEPRRGRMRAALLQPRSNAYFAPRQALHLVRLLLVVALGLSAVGAVTGGDFASSLAVHFVALLVGGLALEMALRKLSRRGLPDRTDDMALECALRVADARAVVAAGLLLSSVGLWMGSIFLLRNAMPGAEIAVSQFFNVALIGLFIWAITLIQPVREWRPA